MKRNCVILSLVVALLGLLGCKKQNADLEQILPTIDDFTLAPGASQEISFNAHDTWTIAADKEWLTFDPASGDKGGVLVTCTAADGFTSETAKVTLTFGQGAETVTFNVTRSEKQRSIKFTIANLPLFSLEFGESKKTVSFDVTANYNWELDTEAQTWPAWLQKPTVKSGTLNESTKEYTGTINLAVDEEAIKNFYDQKDEFNITFIDINSTDEGTNFPVTHTFEAPVVVSDGVIRSDYGQTLTLGKDGKFKEADAASVTFTLHPGEGETDFKAYTVMTDFAAGSNTRTASAQYTQPYLTFKKNEDETYTLTAIKYPEAYVNDGGTSCQPIDTKIFVLPSTIYGLWMSTPINAQDPAMAFWWAFNQDTLTDYSTNAVTEDNVKYAIVINVEQ